MIDTLTNQNTDKFHIGKIQIIEICVGAASALLVFIAVVIIFAVIVKLCRRVCKKCKDGKFENTEGGLLKIYAGMKQKHKVYWKSRG